LANTLYFAFCALFWGASFIAIKTLIHDVPSFTSAFYRVGFSLLFLILIRFKKIQIPKNLTAKDWGLFIWGGLCSMGLPFSFLFWGEKYVSAGLAGMINGTVPIFSLVIGILFFGDRQPLTKKKVLGLVLGVLGISLIFYPKVSFSGNQKELMGMIAIIAMSVSYGFGVNLNARIFSRFGTSISKESNLLLQLISGVVYLLVLSFVFDGVPDLSLLLIPKNALSVFYLAFFSTILGFMLFYKLIENTGHVRASATTFFVPIVALLLDSLINNTIPGPHEALGGLIILVSLYFIKDFE